MSAELKSPHAFAPDAVPVAPGRHADTPLALYDIQWLDAAGRERWDSLRLPAEGAVAGAAALFARGTPIETPQGPVAVEDLAPGDTVTTPDGTARLCWTGMRSHAPTEARPHLYRIRAEALGRACPADDLVLGAGAHILLTGPQCRPLVGGDAALAPVAALADGLRVIAVRPPGEVATFGLACAGQEVLLAGGVPVAAYHPARDMMRRVTPSTLDDLKRLVPPLAQGFGVARTPYLTVGETQTLPVL